jgi:hypothetical protein
MSNHKKEEHGVASKAAPPKATKEDAAVKDVPPVDPYADFEEPDLSKAIIDQTTPSNIVQVLVVDANFVLEGEGVQAPNGDKLVFAQSGISYEWMVGNEAKRKFVQDKDGQIYYNSHGVAPNDDFKQVDIVAAGT